jgi:hypothetical protein
MSTASPRPQAAGRQRSAPLDAAAPTQHRCGAAPRRAGNATTQEVLAESSGREARDCSISRRMRWHKRAARCSGVVEEKRREIWREREVVHVGTPRLSLSSPMLRCARIARTFKARNPCAISEARVCPQSIGQSCFQDAARNSSTGTADHRIAARTGAHVCRRTPDAHMRAQAHRFFSAKRR